MVAIRSLMAFSLTAPACGAIVDLMLIQGSNPNCPENYSPARHDDKLNGDLNQHVGGSTIWLCVRESTVQSTTENDAITDLTIIGGSSNCGDVGSNWHRVKQAQGSNGDMNHHAPGTNLYLCYQKDATKSPLINLNLRYNAGCHTGFHRALIHGSANGDLNQHNRGYTIYLCVQRGCLATSVEGQWVTHGGQLPVTATHETWSVGTHQSSSVTNTSDWKESVSRTVNEGWKLKSESGSVEITDSYAHETSKTFTSAWSEDETFTYGVDWDAEDKGKQPWQFEFSPSDSCGNTLQSKARVLALTEGAWRPPCCVPGYCTDAPACKTCRSKDTMIAGGEAYGCKVDASGATLV